MDNRSTKRVGVFRTRPEALTWLGLDQETPGGPWGERSEMLYMIVERFKNGDPVPVYRRFRSQGRQLPEGLIYISSWVTTDMTTCYQLMECEDRRLLDQWIAAGRDLVDFEVSPVITSAEAVERIAPRL